VAAQLQRQSVSSPTGWLVEGDVHMLGKRFDAAAKAYERAYALTRSGSTAIKLHAAMVQDGRVEEGEARLRGWLKQEPGDVSTRLYLAEAYLKSANYRKAIEEYEYLLVKQGENIVILNNLAWCYQQIKDKRAVETAERALKLKPDNPAVIDTLGWILVESGDVGRGVQLLKQATGMAPKSPEIRFHLAQGLLRAGEKNAARAELERLLVDYPKFPEHVAAMHLLGELRR